MSILSAAGRSARWLSRGLLDLVLPTVCPGCSARTAGGDAFCEPCAADLLQYVSMPYCPRCGSTIGPNLPTDIESCLACPQPLPRFARVVRLGPYAGPLRTFVRSLKYRRRQSGLGPVSRMLAEAVGARLEPPVEAVVPVPAHWRRRLERGHDHSRTLAASIARRLSVPLGDDLVRSRSTPPQAHLSRTQRFRNVRGCFAVRRGSQLGGAHLLLVDDVTTTGATASEAARTLLRAGAERVSLAVVAKAEPKRAYAPPEE